jgi:phosphoribosylglycinamide formyltransferase-1
MGLKTLKLAIFISGRGSNMRAIIESCKNPNFPAQVVMVLSNRPDAAGITFAKECGIPTEIVDHKSYPSREAFEIEISNRLKNHEIDFIVLAGFLRVLTASFIEQWPHKIINIHPSLLPEYKGLHTHARAIADGKAEAGCTVHFVVPEIDSGEIILQKHVPIFAGDTPESLSARILKQEHIAYPEAIRLIAEKQEGFS